MTDAVTELIEHRKQQAGLSPMLKRVWALHGRNPELFDFLIHELREVRESGWPSASVRSLWEHGRWVLRKQRVLGEQFSMANAIAPYYARLITILHPEFNGFFAMAKSKADADFGTALEKFSNDHKPGYIRRLLWADGKEIQHGWRPSTPHEPKPVSRRKRVQRRDESQ